MAGGWARGGDARPAARGRGPEARSYAVTTMAAVTGGRRPRAPFLQPAPRRGEAARGPPRPPRLPSPRPAPRCSGTWRRRCPIDPRGHSALPRASQAQPQPGQVGARGPRGDSELRFRHLPASTTRVCLEVWGTSHQLVLNTAAGTQGSPRKRRPRYQRSDGSRGAHVLLGCARSLPGFAVNGSPLCPSRANSALH